jgi:hypothetical protein
LGEDLNDLVKCYSGDEYAQRPTALCWEDQWLDVSAIEVQWRTPHGKAFRVRTRDNRGFELSWNESADEWKITEI